MNFNEKMKLLRKELGLTQEQASKAIPMSIASIKNYEKDRFPDSQQLKRIKDFYKVPYEYLLNDECNTREEDNLKIGEKLGLSDKSINLLKELSSNGKAHMFEKLLEYIYNKNILNNIEELSNVNYIIEKMFNDVCPKLEKIFNSQKYDNITESQIQVLEYFIKYHISVREKINDIQVQDYLRYLINNNYSEYLKFIDNLTYIIPTFNYKAKVNEDELKIFNNYKKIKQIFMEYKLYLFTNIFINVDNDFVKTFNLNK